MASSQQSEKFYSITNSEDGPAEILIYDAIGSNSFWEETVSAKGFVKDLKAIGNKKDVVVRINSPGGSVFDGTAIYNALRNHKGNVAVKIDGIALSMASVVAMAGDSVEMADNALMMIHNPRAVAVGDSNDMRAYADLLDKAKTGLVAAYMSRSSKATEEISALMDAETWLTASEAKELGLVDNVTESNLAVAASFDVNAVSANGVTVPKKFAKQVAAFANTRTERDDMSEQTKEPRAATVNELMALAGADETFAVAQLKANATMEQAIVALNAKLLSQVEASKKEIEDLKAAAATAGGESDEGIEPIASAKHSQTNGDTVPASKKNQQKDAKAAWGDDPVAFYRDKLVAACDSGEDPGIAADRIEAANPGLADAMREFAMTAAN
jgi:ATP-dependent Clp protease protease subunit